MAFKYLAVLVYLLPLVSASVTSPPTAQHRVPSTNVCGDPCKITCFAPSQDVNPDDCAVLASQIREPGPDGDLFTITAGGFDSHASGACATNFLNNDHVDLTYCFTDWADLIISISSKCQRQAGRCVSTGHRNWTAEAFN